MQQAKQQEEVSSDEATAASKNQLICRLCDKKFLFPSVLIRHMRKHTNERTNQCKICKKGFSDKSSLMIHMRSHTSTNQPPGSESTELAENLHMQNPMEWLVPLEDPDSEEIGQSEETVSDDAQMGQRPDHLGAADKASTDAEMWSGRDQPFIDLTSAGRDAGMERAGLFQKESISRIFSRTPQQGKGYRQPHLRKRGILCIEKTTGHSGEPAGPVNPGFTEEEPGRAPGMSQCPSGSKSDGQPPAAKPQTGHFVLCPNGKALKCNYCPFICRRTCGRMIKHLQVHGIRSRNQCKSCGLGFLNKSELQDHQKVCSQSSLAPQCSECGKTFSFRSLLRQHMNTHINKKPHRCKECPMTFNSALLFHLHMEKQHPSATQGSVLQCTLCQEQFENNDELECHLQTHLAERQYKCSFCGMKFSSPSARYNHIGRVHKVNPTASQDEISLQACFTRSLGTSSPGMPATSGVPSSMVSSPGMTMPIVVSVSSQSKADTPTSENEASSLNRPNAVGGPSELTAGSPERISDSLDRSAGGLVYMRKELNPEIAKDDRGLCGPSVLRSWSVSESSDPLATPESAVIQIEENPNQPPGSQLIFVKKESEDEVSNNEGQHCSMVNSGRLSVKSGSRNQRADSIPSLVSHQQLEPTSTAEEGEVLNPAEVYPVQYQQYIGQNPARSNENPQRLLDINRVMASPSPDGSYGRRSADDTTNPESPCRATSTRRSLDAQDTYPGSHRCGYCDIAFGDPIMHYLHMGWHVTGDPWKCNGCGQECAGRVDFFLHLYKAGHN